MIGRVIYGEDLVRVARQVGMPKKEVSRIDPEGWNIVKNTLLHNDDGDVRVFLMMKTVKDTHPVEGVFDIPLSMFNKIVRNYDTETKEVNHDN